MSISFENILERDIDLLMIQQFSSGNQAFIKLFSDKVGIDSDQLSVSDIFHSVMTSDGESDVEVIFWDGKERVAFLLEDKIDAIAQPEQAKRYEIRAEKAVKSGRFNSYYIFIVAPQKYLDGNKEASLYPNTVSYEELLAVITDDYGKAVLSKALDESKHGYIPIEDQKVTLFWDKLYDYIDEHYPDTFSVHGKKGESRGTKARWISISSGKGTSLQIKADRGYVDLEISGYADKFQEFSKANQELLDRKKLYVRVASKSLAIRKYIEPIDFTADFDSQVSKVDDALLKAMELQNLVKDLKY